MSLRSNTVDEPRVFSVEPGDKFNHRCELGGFLEVVVADVKFRIWVNCAGRLERKGNEAL